MKGQLAASWEMPDANTYVAHLRKGIRWQGHPAGQRAGIHRR